MELRIPHHPALLDTLRRPTPDAPLRILVSGCLTGLRCGVDGSDYGMGRNWDPWAGLKTARWLAFCPEDHGIGTPRTMPDLHGGDGFAVLRGEARVRDEHGADLTEQMLDGARAMRDFALAEGAELALLTDMSAACGSQVIALGCRLVPPAQRRYQQGVGVATALLLEAGIPVLSQRDHRSVARLRALLDGSPVASGLLDSGLLDHHEHPWVVEHFG